MTHITFSLFPELKQLFKTKCGAIPYARVLRGLIKAFVSDKIKLEDLEIE